MMKRSRFLSTCCCFMLPLLMLMTQGCSTLPTNVGLTEARCVTVGRMATLGYLVYRPNLDPAQRLAVATGYGIFHTSLESIAAKSTDAWIPFLDAELAKHIDDPVLRELAILLFQEATASLVTYIESNMGDIAESDVLKYLIATDSGIQQTLKAHGIVTTVDPVPTPDPVLE